MKTTRQTTIAVTLPVFSLRDLLTPLFAAMDNLVNRLPNRRALMKLRQSISGRLPSNFPRPGRKLKIALPVILLVILLGGILWWAKGVVFPAVTGNQKTSLKGPIAQMTLNEELLLPINDDKGEELTKVKYVVKTAELRDEIIVGGRKATTIEGQAFLVLTIDITNDYSQPIQINSRDFLQVSVNNDDSKWYSPKIHSDPVDVRPGSTNTTRIGLTINSGDENIRLRLGEVTAEKRIIAVKF
jgi:hypothetical protein